MEPRADLVAYDRTGTVRVWVEVKNRPGTSVEWATGFRRNLRAHGRMPTADYFVVATPTHLHVWKEPGGAEERPTVTLNARELWTRYFGRELPPPGSGEAFELVVGAWFSDVAHRWDAVKPADPDSRRLEEIGLPQAIRGGHVEHCVAA